MRIFIFSLIMLGALLLPQISFGQCEPDSTVPSSSGIYPDSLVVPGCQFFDTTVTFILPRDTTETAGGITIPVPFISFIIDSITGLPDGISWECNLGPDCRYVVSRDSMDVDTIGCIRLFGTTQVPSFYTITVHLTADFVLFGQVASQGSILTAPLTVNNCIFTGDCYTLNLDSNCEPAILDIQNNVPSNGKSGFSYDWSITSNNGFSFSSQDENVASQMLTQAGEYYIDYNASIDTLGYSITNARIDAVNCTDILDPGDLYWYLIAPNGDTLANTFGSPITNGGGNLPIFTGINTSILDSGTYRMEVWDFDNIGSDDGCATNSGGSGADISFAIPPSNRDSLSVTSGGLTVTFFFNNPVQEISCSDTISIFPTPASPDFVVRGDTLQGPLQVDWCVTETLEIAALGDSIEWFLNGNQVPSKGGAFVLEEGGTYEALLVNTTTFCRSVASEIVVIENQIATPAIVKVVDTIFVGSPNSQYTYSWFDIGGTELAQGTSFTPFTSGQFFVVATDNVTGCKSVGSDTLQLTLTNIEELLNGNFSLYPNPASDFINLKTELSIGQSSEIYLRDLPGRLVRSWSKSILPGEQLTRLNIGDLNRGVYFLELRMDGRSWTQKIVID